ncbi:hypothetical protein C8R43DRAFT_1132257 [Mycena crocata]|nr:hypothetical protein C8R43DRAFT_1132257 [Mycena crocata]
MDHIRDLMHSHHPLAAGQLSPIQASLDDEIARADEEISKQKTGIDDVVARRTELRAQYENCSSLDAPVRSLPSEVLVEIFALHSVIFRMAENFDLTDDLALFCFPQAPLLILSQVCARWHTIAINTPSLWSDIFLSSLLWDTPTSTETASKLLQTALERGGNHPLNIFVTDSDIGMPEAALGLIVAHSERWRAVELLCPLTELEHFSGLSLPRLETMGISSIDLLGEDTDHCFKAAPRLRSLSIYDAVSPPLFTPHFDRLSWYPSCPNSRYGSSSGFNSGSTGGPILPKRFRLGIHPTSSDISVLTIEVAGRFHIKRVQYTLAQIMENLTLPHLHTLAFHSVDFPHYSLMWSNRRFLALARRSSFHLHLRTLDLCDVAIAEPQLLPCLALLPVLEHLEIADHARIDGHGHSMDVLLVTDSLLRALTDGDGTSENTDANPHIGPALVPCLTHIHLRTQLKFSDTAYLAFVRARRPFSSEIVVMSGVERDWRPLRAQLQAQEGLVSTVMNLMHLPSSSTSYSSRRPIRNYLFGTDCFVSFPDCDGPGQYLAKGKKAGAWNAVLPDFFIQRLSNMQRNVPNFDATVTGMLFGQGKTNICLFKSGFDANFDNRYINSADHPLYKVSAEFSGTGTEGGTTETRWNLPTNVAAKLAELKKMMQAPEE